MASLRHELLQNQDTVTDLKAKPNPNPYPIPYPNPNPHPNPYLNPYPIPNLFFDFTGNQLFIVDFIYWPLIVSRLLF